MIATVCIPVRDCASRVGEAIESAQAQTVDVEVLVVDDGSSDGSADVAKAAGARVEQWPESRGAPAARNRLAELASGTWLQFLDADDVMFPTKVERQLLCSDGADAVWSDTVVVHPTGRRDYCPAHPLGLWMTGAGACVPTGGWLVRRDRFVPFPDVACRQDAHWAIDMAKAGLRLVRCPEYLWEYRVAWSPTQITAVQDLAGEALRVRQRATTVAWPD